MTTTELFRNFHVLMTSCLPPLLKAGVSVGDDEWDDFVELLFEITVCIPVERNTGQKIHWRYGCWDGDRGPRTQIQVRAMCDGTFLIGKTQTEEGGAISVVYGTQQLEGDSVVFMFRQLGHPFKNQQDSDWLDYVQGELVDTGGILPAGTQVCMPIDDCEFMVG